MGTLFNCKIRSSLELHAITIACNRALALGALPLPLALALALALALTIFPPPSIYGSINPPQLQTPNGIRFAQLRQQGQHGPFWQNLSQLSLY